MADLDPEGLAERNLKKRVCQFNVCAAANTWNAAKKLAVLPAFLRGPAAAYYHTLADDEKDTFEHLTTSLQGLLCPAVGCEQYYRDFEQCLLRPTEEPSLFLWSIRDLLSKVEPGYVLTGCHGETPLSPQPPSGSVPVDRPVASDPQPSTTNSCLFVQSLSWSPVPICLKTCFSLPCRTEVTVVGKISQNSQIRLGMVIPIENESVLRNIHAAYSVCEAQHYEIPVRLLNTSNVDVELTAGTSIGQFCQIVETFPVATRGAFERDTLLCGTETGEITLVRGDGVPNGEDMGNLAENGDHQHDMLREAAELSGVL
eukprot:gene2724-3149_t